MIKLISSIFIVLFLGYNNALSLQRGISFPTVFISNVLTANPTTEYLRTLASSDEDANGALSVNFFSNGMTQVTVDILIGGISTYKKDLNEGQTMLFSIPKPAAGQEFRVNILSSSAQKGSAVVQIRDNGAVGPGPSDLANLQLIQTVEFYLSNVGLYTDFEDPSGVAYTDNNGNPRIYVADQYHDLLIAFDKNFKFIKEVSVDYPKHIAVSNNAVYVNVWNDDVYKYDFELNLQKTVTPKCSYYCSLYDLAYDFSTDTLYVAEDGYDEGVHVFDKDLNLIKFIDTSRYDLGPTGIAYYSPTRTLMVGGYDEILTLKDGVYKVYDSICPGYAYIFSICIYKDKYVLVDCSDDDIIQILDLNTLQPTGQKLKTSATPQSIATDGQQIMAGVWGYPSGIDIFA